ncbi:Olfactory receptor 7E24 [Sciurus carolinensis]|uniref:Olfactory receptor 7E24 n=1 Tax=Sciurus carolinensis TaxID=30640 RepID=A0AA41N8Y5_SCICA|nr:Olfactory receptor 7E24 [Sciurus carolinensis]
MCTSNTEQHNQTGVTEFQLRGHSEDPDLQPILFGLFLFMYLVTELGNLLIMLALYKQNRSTKYDTCLMELSEDPDLQPILLGLFLSMYLVTVLGNLLIILTVSSDSHLHNPMYFFLSNLSLTDICFISTTDPKMLVNIQTHSRAISYVGCLTQMSLFIIFGCMNDMLLTMMAYDYFMAICQPLHYQVIMNPRLCGLLVLVSFFLGFLESLLHNLVGLPFTNTKNTVRCFVGAFYGFLPLSGICFSYYKIVSTILRIPSSSGKYKTFSTCGSHLSVVCLFYRTGIGLYFSSDQTSFTRKGAVASVMYTVITPMLNPFVYSLSNKDIKCALRTV